MSNHVLRLRVVRGGFAKGRLELVCSCDPDRSLLPGVAPDTVMLGGLNELAHEHIEAAERSGGYGGRLALDEELPGMWETADLIGGETDT